MISRRDKLLVRPWEQRRYEYHRQKVQFASPAIDNRPPAYRAHVSCKLKKQQKETERCDKIEKDNLKLLQRLRNLMSTSRVDNNWTKAQPNFLNRVTIRDKPPSGKFIAKIESPSIIDDKTRKGRCVACTPKKQPELKIPEERMPFPPPKPPISRRRSQSVPCRKVQIVEKPRERASAPIIRKTPEKKIDLLPKKQARSRSSRLMCRAPLSAAMLPPKANEMAGQSIVLSRGDIHLAVSFPSDTQIKLQEGHIEKLLRSGTCYCKAIRS